MALRTRAILSDQSQPKLKPHARLQYDRVRSAWALLAPEKILWPDDVSLSILRLCDGRKNLSEILTELALEYQASEADIRPDVEEFLQNWSDRALVSL